MKYLIFCKKTHKHIATYTNKKTLEILDTERCYYTIDTGTEWIEYREIVEVKAEKRKPQDSYTNSYKKTKIQNDPPNPLNDYMNPVNPIVFYASQSYDSSSSSSCDSSSSYSDSSSSSSSCDSSSSW